MCQLKVNYDVKQTDKTYFEFGHIISEVGGIGASVKIMLAAMGILWVVRYVIDLSKLLKRQFKHKVNVLKIKMMKRLLPKIKDAIINKKDKGYQGELRTIKYIEKASIRYYEDAELILTDLTNFVSKYDIVDDQSPPEDILLLKHQEQRLKLSDSEVAKFIIKSVSFHGIYKIGDKIQEFHIYIRNLKEQLKSMGNEGKQQRLDPQHKKVRFETIEMLENLPPDSSFEEDIYCDYADRIEKSVGKKGKR